MRFAPEKNNDAVVQVSEQPLTFGALTVNGYRQVRYNARKLSELPYHLIESGMDAELRKHVLFNYEWLHSKLAAASLPDVLADLHMATTSVSITLSTKYTLEICRATHILSAAKM